PLSDKGGNMRITLLAALACAAAVAGAATSAASAAGSTECNGTFTNTTLSGGVVVNEGDVCDLGNVIVNGGLTGDGGTAGAQLSVNTSTINGGWSITGVIFPGGVPGNGFTGYFCGDNVAGGLSAVDTELFGAPLSFGELNAGCTGGTINGPVTISNNDGPV